MSSLAHAAKRQKTSHGNKASAEAPSPSKVVSPKEAHFNRLDEFMEKLDGCLGQMLVVGIENDVDEEEEEEEEYTVEQMSQLRHILITKSRNNAIEEAMDFVTCGQVGDVIMMFNTRTGNNVCFGLPNEIRKCLKGKSVPAKFDKLFGLTYGLHFHNDWMNDNECWEPGGALNIGIRTLARAWKKLLSHSNEELGIDAEYTRPGIEALLEKLQGAFKDCDASSRFPFNWRPPQ